MWMFCMGQPFLLFFGDFVVPTARACGLFFRLYFNESAGSEGMHATTHCEIARGEGAYGVEPVEHLCRCRVLPIF
jgi:hypothetical protein